MQTRNRNGRCEACIDALATRAIAAGLLPARVELALERGNAPAVEALAGVPEGTCMALARRWGVNFSHPPVNNLEDDQP